MPLKHTTETFLLLLLALAIAVTGIVIPTLPPVTEGIVPWGIAFIIAALYPLALSPVFRSGRADYAFRLLHWVPAFMLVLWLLGQLFERAFPLFERVLGWYTWAWTLPAVALGLFLLMLFSFQVIRRWVLRIGVLALFLVAFAVGGILSERKPWTSELAATLWQGDWWKAEQGSGGIAQGSERSAWTAVPSSQSSASSLSSEPTVVAQVSESALLREIRERQQRLREKLGLASKASSSAGAMEHSAGSVTQSSKVSSLVAAALSSPRSSLGSGTMGQSSSRPSSLPHSGMGWGEITSLLIAGYFGVLHHRARRRNLAMAYVGRS